MRPAVFFSGTHGCGKTKTIERVLGLTDSKIFEASDGDHGNPHKDPYQRQVWRLTKYYLDSLEVRAEQGIMKEGRLLVDRGVFDHEAYTSTFHSLGWLSGEQKGLIQNVMDLYFRSSDLLPHNIVWFNPPEEWTIDRIKSRWNDEKKKWNEGDFDYLRDLRNQFARIYERERDRRNVLVVEETDLDARVDRIVGFMKSL